MSSRGDGRITAPPARPRRRLALALLIAVAGGVGVPPSVPAHDAGNLQDEFIKGVFSPAFVPPPAGSYELPAIRKVSAFTLRDAAGRPANTRTLMAGKVAVVSFIYTACVDRTGCPLASVTLRDLQAKLRDEGLAQQAVLLSISFDPGRDTPSELAKYARIYDADPALWQFLTVPSRPLLARVLDSYGQDQAPVYDERGRFTGRYRHVLKVFLVDRDGHVRNIYSAGLLSPALVVNDIKTVLGANGSRSPRP